MIDAPSIEAWKQNAQAALTQDLGMVQAALTDEQAAQAQAVLAEILRIAAPIAQAAATVIIPGPGGAAVGVLASTGATTLADSLTSQAAQAAALTPEQQALATEIAQATAAAIAAKLPKGT